MAVALTFSYRAILRRTRRSSPVEARVRAVDAFELKDLDGKRADFDHPWLHRRAARSVYPLERRLIADGAIYRAIRGPDGELAVEEFSRMMTQAGKARGRIHGRSIADFWWRDAYGLEPGPGSDCALRYPTLLALKALEGWNDYVDDAADRAAASTAAFATILEHIALDGDRVMIADAEPVWTVSRRGRDVSINLETAAQLSPAHRSFAFGRRDEAVAYAMTFPSFDGMEPPDVGGPSLTRRSDSVAMARELLPVLKSVRRAAATLGDVEVSGASCYDTLNLDEFRVDRGVWVVGHHLLLAGMRVIRPRREVQVEC